jgi:glycosyltransferase involved in cell wall biosynthesis
VNLTCVILTFNEEVHIARAINSVRAIADRVVIVDSGSADSTLEIAASFGAEILKHPWVNHATQFNWALTQLPSGTDWVLRLDADEVLTPALQAEIATALPSLDQAVDGVYVPRRMTFLRRPIRHGGVFPVFVLRLFRHGRGRCENRWMDEHIIVSGPTRRFAGELIDDSLKPLSWWTDKHNAYASREVIEMLNLEYGFMPREMIACLADGEQAGAKRWIKEQAYARLPRSLRALVYFVYRYVLRLGFLDGYEGLAFHVLQGFWYRFLVDVKLHEVRRAMRSEGLAPVQAIKQVLGISLDLTETAVAADPPVVLRMRS